MRSIPVATWLFTLVVTAGCGKANVDTISLFYGGAHAFGPIQWSEKAILDELQLFAEGKPADKEKIRKAVQQLEKDIQDRRKRLADLESEAPAGASVAPLLKSCHKQVEVAETVFLPHAQEFLEKADKWGDTNPVTRLTAIGNGQKCFHAQQESEGELAEKFESFEQEFAQQLKKSGRLE